MATAILPVLLFLLTVIKTSGNLISFFGRINYILAGKYLATISVRHEADSKICGFRSGLGYISGCKSGMAD